MDNVTPTKHGFLDQLIQRYALLRSLKWCRYFSSTIFIILFHAIFKILWQNLHQLHDISSCSKAGGCQGKTEILFTIPELKKKKSYHHNIHHGEIGICKTLYMRQPNKSGCLPEFINLFDLISFNSRVELMNTEAAFNLDISFI
jgi:hypothetical protein